MASTYVPIAAYTVSGSTTNEVSFNSFSGYTDLVLICDVLGASGASDAKIEFNGSSTGYSETVLRGNGSAASSTRYTTGYLNSAASLGSATRYSFIVNIMNYANANTYKTALIRENNSAAEVGATALLYSSTSAITSLRVFLTNTEKFTSGSTFTIYGIQAA